MSKASASRFGQRRQHMQPRILPWTSGLICLLFLISTSTALGAPPSHPRTPASDLSGFDHACGAAVDTEGDIYVSSAGESKVRIFDPTHSEIASISNADEPCGLALDEKGNLYVSEKATGEVVRYTPNVYPFSGEPIYGAPTTIDSSGDAEGISVDPHDGRLYVAEGGHIAVYESDGSFEADLGVGDLTKATGVAAYTYVVEITASEGDIAEERVNRYLFVADTGSDQVKIFGGPAISPRLGPIAAPELHKTLSGPTTGEDFGLASTGAGVATDQTNGHLLVYDAGHKAVDEFEASGAFVTQIHSPEAPAAFDDAMPTAIAAYPTLDEVQRLHVSATSGSFTLTFEGDTTAQIEAPASNSAVLGALEELPAVGAGNVLVSTFGDGGEPNVGYMVTFSGAVGPQNVGALECNGSGLTGGTASCAVAAERNGSGPAGRIYVTSGSSSGSKVLGFGELIAPSRPPLPKPSSLDLSHAGAVGIDSAGNRYIGVDQSIYIYPPLGETPLTKIDTGGGVSSLAIDSTGKVYALLDRNDGLGGTKERVAYFTPPSFPPDSGTKYSPPTIVAKRSAVGQGQALTAVAVNPLNDHIYVSNSDNIVEFGSAAAGLPVLNPAFGTGVVPALLAREALAVDGASGNVYVGGKDEVDVLDSSGSKLRARITGAGSPLGRFAPGDGLAVAVDQSNGHVLIFDARRGAVEEYEASGAFVAAFGTFAQNLLLPNGVAIDNSDGSTNGNVYAAFDDPVPNGSFDLTAFGPLAYGGPPLAETSTASKVGGGGATLNGKVNPRGLPVTACSFEYTSETAFGENGFTSAEVAPCSPSAGEIGSGNGSVSVHADLAGVELEGRYRFRLVAENQFGASEGKAGIFGPPLLNTEAASPVAYTEATLRAALDPSGLATTYHFEYGTSETYGQSSPTVEIAPSAGPTEIVAPITGLAEGTAYHFRIFVQNEAMSIEGPDQGFETLQRPGGQSCPNEEFRGGSSANLPDCRAYELVTPAETKGMIPNAAGPGIYSLFSNSLVPLRGSAAGSAVSFFVDGTLPGFDGNGIIGGYTARRGNGLHPDDGWASTSFSPSYAEGGGLGASQQGVSSDQKYSFWHIGTDPLLRTPAGFEPLGQGSLGVDQQATGVFLAPGGNHVIFSSAADLEDQEGNEAPPAGTKAVYDRAAGEANAEVVSLRPDGLPFGAGEDASYLAATEDGSNIAFSVGGAIYVRRGGEETVEVAGAPSTFAGISDDGRRVFYVAAVVSGTTPAPGGLFVCEVEAGPCAGADASHEPVEIAPASRFANVSADGHRVYFISTSVLDDALEGSLDANNLYIWDADDETTRFITTLDSQDLASQGFEDFNINLIQWLHAVGPASPGISTGRGVSPMRSSPDGSILLFQSHASLTPYDAKGYVEVYRYDAVANGGTGGLSCISCDPTGSLPGSDATLQTLRAGGPTKTPTLIPNVTDDGRKAFFETADRLLPEDANSVNDVYEWTAQGSSCKRAAGCLALISSGQGEKASYLYGMSADGHDLFFRTLEKLVSEDVSGSSSIYDARIGGGIPDLPTAAPCQGDACQGAGSVPPTLPTPSSATPRSEGGEEGKAPCRKGKRLVKRGGRSRCIRRHTGAGKRHRRTHRANHDRRAQR